jgi:hypothetical protein
MAALLFSLRLISNWLGINILDQVAHFYRLILPSFILQWSEKNREKNI